MIQNVLILSASQYRITNDKTGEVENEGTTVRYLLSVDLAPAVDPVRPVLGHVPAKATLPVGAYDELRQTPVPGFYEAQMTNRIDSQGKVSIAATAFKFIGGVAVGAANGGNKFKMPSATKES